MSDFIQRVALVTGSGRGIGKAIALRLAREGADVVLNFYRNRQPAEETAEAVRAVGRQALVVKANVGDLDDLDRLFDETESAFGRLDVYVHNAATGYNRPALQQKPKGWEWTINVNARSFLFGAQRAARLMTNGGSIVALSSMGSQRVLPEYVLVGASKAALESLVRYLGVELAPLNIRVNAVSPGVVLTGALEHFATFRDEEKDVIEEVTARTPAGRLCTPEDVADVVAFLCSPPAQMICGQTLVVDGGYSLLAR